MPTKRTPTTAAEMDSYAVGKQLHSEGHPRPTDTIATEAYGETAPWLSAGWDAAARDATAQAEQDAADAAARPTADTLALLAQNLLKATAEALEAAQRAWRANTDARTAVQQTKPGTPARRLAEAAVTATHNAQGPAEHAMNVTVAACIVARRAARAAGADVGDDPVENNADHPHVALHIARLSKL